MAAVAAPVHDPEATLPDNLRHLADGLPDLNILRLVAFDDMPEDHLGHEPTGHLRHSRS